MGVKTSERNMGGLWENEDGSFYGSIEIDGEQHKFYAYPNKYKKEGDRRPDFAIFPHTPKGETAERPAGPPINDDDAPF